MAPTLDELRSQYEESLLSVAHHMRDAAKAAETLAEAIANVPIINGHTKGKGKTGDEEVVNGKRKRSKKDPNAPKRPASSFFLFQNQIRAKMKEQHPELPSAELRRLMAEQWNTLPDEQKKHFKQKADELKVAYSEEKEKYNARSPEEVAAADAAAATAAAAKKTSKSRKPATNAPVVATKSAVHPASGSEESGNDSSEDEKIKTKPGKPMKSAPTSSRKFAKSDPVVAPDSEEEEDDDDDDEDSDQGKGSSEDEEDEEPPAKKSKSKHHEKPVSRRK